MSDSTRAGSTPADHPADSGGSRLVHPDGATHPAHADPAPLPDAAVRLDGPFPQTFGRYRLCRRLGRGAMATVYLAEDTRLETQVALKVPHPHLLDDPAPLERFYREAKIAARLCHPHLCQVFDVDQLDGIHYLTMRYIEGTPLSQCPPRAPREAAELVRKLAAALAEAHRLGVVHRDLKPANILITPHGDPVVTDFGMALRLDTADERLTQSGALVGTPLYMAPEQFRGDPEAIGPACDIYSLGVILYELLTGQLPFAGPGMWRLQKQVLNEPLVAPSRHRPDLDPWLEAVCLRALAREVKDRFATIDEFAAALADSPRATEPAAGGETWPSGVGPRPDAANRPLVRREAVRFAFARPGERAPAPAALRDRLYLAVGSDLRPGIIDHHHLTASSGSTASLVLAHPDFVAAAVAPGRAADAGFTVVLHEKPNLDALASAYLALSYLTTGAFAPGADALARYVDKVGEGSLGMTLTNPFSLYAAYLQLGNRLMRRRWNSHHERWQEWVRGGLEVVAYVLEQVVRQGTPLPAVDAFACPGRFGPEDRGAVQSDVERYHRKLAAPQTHARQARLRLPGQLGGTVEVETLLVRDVQNVADPQRCLFFKDWARTDAVHCANGRGFVALSVFASESPGQVRRCILSVTPDSGASLRGLGRLLDEAEAERRRQVFGVDDRVTDPTTDAPRPPRPGYANADPWYDGRAHGYTYVDAPRSGTLLTADEVEALFLQFGGRSSA